MKQLGFTRVVSSGGQRVQLTMRTSLVVFLLMLSA